MHACWSHDKIFYHINTVHLKPRLLNECIVDKMMYRLLIVVLLEAVALCSCQIVFNITRAESGDEVATSLNSGAAYCTAIQAYLSGSNCKCNWRRTFSLDLQTCIDYYNSKHMTPHS